MRALKNLGTTIQIFRRREEAQHVSNLDLIPSLESMAEFLVQRCRTLGAMDVAMAAYAPGTQVWGA